MKCGCAYICTFAHLLHTYNKPSVLYLCTWKKTQKSIFNSKFILSTYAGIFFSQTKFVPTLCSIHKSKFYDILSFYKTQNTIWYAHIIKYFEKHIKFI